jgi:hypothetical protein
MGDERQSYPEAEERGEGGGGAAGLEQTDAPAPPIPAPDGGEDDPTAIEAFDEEGAGIAAKE